MSRGDNESPHSTQRTGAKKGQGMHPPDQNLHTIMGDSKDRLKEDQEHGSQREATVDQRRPAKPPPDETKQEMEEEFQQKDTGRWITKELHIKDKQMPVSPERVKDQELR